MTADIPAGGALTLTVGDAYYAPQFNSASFPAGAPVYGYVDSLNYATGYSAVREINEGNNRFGPVNSTAGSEAVALNSQGAAALPASLPQR